MLKRSPWLILWTFLFGMLFWGCAPVRQAEVVELSGFLDDYSILIPGKEGEFLYFYRSPHVKWASYDKVLLDRVLIWQNYPAKERRASVVDLQQAANRFYLFLYQELSRDYEIVSTPGPGTFVIQMALTDVERPSLDAETFASVFPPALFISAGTELVTGESIFANGVSFEGRITDGGSGDLLVAAVDRRLGGKTLEGAVDSWSDIHTSFELWSQMVRLRLWQLRWGKFCIDSGG